MKQMVFAFIMMLSLAACSGEAANEESAPEDDTVSGAEMPADQPLALDSSHNVRVVEHGLQFEDGYYYACGSSGQRWVPSNHQYRADDTALFNPVVTGLGMADGKVSVSPSFTIRAADGRVIYDNPASKSVSRFPEDEARFATFVMPLTWLDSLASSRTSPHYDIQYTLKDRVTGKSLDGLFRIHVARE